MAGGKPTLEYRATPPPPRQGRRVVAAIAMGIVCGLMLTALVFKIAQRAIRVSYDRPVYKRELIEAVTAAVLFVCLTVPSPLLAARLAARQR